MNLTRYQIRGVAFSDKGNPIDLPYRTPRIDLPYPIRDVAFSEAGAEASDD